MRCGGRTSRQTAMALERIPRHPEGEDQDWLEVRHWILSRKRVVIEAGLIGLPPASMIERINHMALNMNPRRSHLCLPSRKSHPHHPLLRHKTTFLAPPTQKPGHPTHSLLPSHITPHPFSPSSATPNLSSNLTNLHPSAPTTFLNSSNRSPLNSTHFAASSSTSTSTLPPPSSPTAA